MSFGARRSLCLAGAAALLALLGGLARGGVAGGPEATGRYPRAIVLVTVDTLRADHLGFGGYRLPTSPMLDRLAGEGVVFERAYATSSWTPPTMASLFTGVAPMTHGVVSGEVVEPITVRQPVLPESLTTLAELARAHGYRTLGVPSNLHLTADLGFAQGFDRFLDPTRFIPAPAVQDGMRSLLREELGEEWKAAARERPLFLWLHYFDPHDPYLPYAPWISVHAPGAIQHGPASPARKVMRELRRRFPNPDATLREAIRPFYDSEIRRLDDEFGAFWNELAFGDDTLLLFTADHGEEMAEHGALGHSQSLHEELVRVPLFLRWPRGLPAGVRVSAPVSLVDLLPTLAELIGAPPPASIAGRSLVPFAKGASMTSRPAFLELAPPKPFRWAVVDGTTKLIVDPTAGGRSELYDLALDPGESRNLAAERPGEVERLRQELRSWARRQPRAPDQRTRDRLDENLRRELEALGYLGGSEPAQPSSPSPPSPPSPPSRPSPG